MIERTTEPQDAELLARMRWLLRLRWVVVPAFVALLAAGELVRGGSPWAILLLGAALLGLNGLFAQVLSRPRPRRTLLWWARAEAAVVVAVPALVTALQGDPTSAVRFGVVVGVVGAAAVLPRPGEVVALAIWAVAALVAADAAPAGLARAAGAHGQATRWAIEAGVILAVAAIAGLLHRERGTAAARLRLLSDGADRARVEWETTFDQVGEMVLITDLDGLVLRGNRAFAKAVGLRPHELSGRRLASLLAGHPDRWWTARSDGIVSIEDPVFDSTFEVTISRLPDRLVRVARDVGEQRRLYARLVQADKLAAVGTLATGLAHEINNPTAFIGSNLTELRRYLAAYESAFAELAEAALEAGVAEQVTAVLHRTEVAFARREAASAISESQQGMERIRQIVASLRSVARRDQAGEPMQPVSLPEVVDAVIRTAAHDLKAASARIDVRDPVQVLGHRGELVDVVLNLVVNAIQARDEGRPNHVTVELRREGLAAVVRVSDTGKGISPGHMRRLYEPFFTTKGPGQGTGLGLSLARNVVVAHGGTIDVQTEVGVGTTVTVRLPALEFEAAQAEPPPARPPDRAAGLRSY
ncbi:MAG: PAS domain S-box protein [Deltaproteobacteria bacterium]|nr:PAS domain S-box protein [Deltaproteobacteria bacterium]